MFCQMIMQFMSVLPRPKSKNSKDEPARLGAETVVETEPAASPDGASQSSDWGHDDGWNGWDVDGYLWS